MFLRSATVTFRLIRILLLPSIVLILGFNALRADAAEATPVTLRGSTATAVDPLIAPLPPAAPVITATKADELVVDVDGDGVADPGDAIRYTVLISNIGDMAAEDVTFSDTIDANTTLSGTVNVSPLAVDDAYTAIGNTLLAVGVTPPMGVPAVEITGTLFDNDSEFLTDTFSLDAFDAASANGGTVSVNADGSFTYLPPAGFTGVDTFTYTIVDTAGATDVATVTITLDELVWYVNSNLGESGDGRSNDPFTGLASLYLPNSNDDPDDAGHYIFLYEGIYNDSLILEDDQKLIGQGVDLVVGGVTLVTATGRPTINNPGNGVAVAQNNTIRGLDIEGTDIDGINLSGTGFMTLTVDSVTITGTGQALDLTNGVLSTTFDALTSASSDNNGLDLDAVSGTFAVGSGGTTIDNPRGVGIRIVNSDNLSATLGTTAVLDAGSVFASGDGVRLINNVISSTISFDSLTVTTERGNGLVADTSGTVTIGGTANAITAQSGAAVDVTDTDLGAGWVFSSLASTDSGGYGVNFDGVSASGTAVTLLGATQVTNATDDGIRLNNNGAETFAFITVTVSTSNGAGFVAGTSTGFTQVTVSDGASTIDATGGPALDINQAAVALNFNTLSSDASPLQGVDLTNLDATSTLVVSGTTTITNPNQVGIQINGVPGGSSIAFGDVTINGRGDTGIFVNEMDGTMLDFGTVTIPNPNNTGGYGFRLEDSSAGVALESADISDANLTVPQTDTGGIPDNDGDGDAIFLARNTGTFTLNGGTLTSSDGNAIDVRDGAGNMTLTNVSIANVGLDINATGEAASGIFIFDTSATHVLTGSVVTGFNGSGAAGIDILADDAETMRLTISSSTISDGGTGVRAEGRDSYAYELLVDDTGGAAGDSIFEDLSGPGVQADHSGTGTVTTIVRASIFRDANSLIGGHNGIDLDVSGTAATHTFLVENNSFTNVALASLDLAAISTEAAGTFTGKVRNNDIDVIAGSCIGGVLDGGSVAADVTVEANTCDDAGRYGIRYQLANGASGDFRITGNSLGVTTAVANDVLTERDGIELRSRGSGGTVNALVDNNQVVVNEDLAAAADVDVEDSSTMNLSVTAVGGSNAFTNNGLGREFDATTEDAGAGLCLNVDGQNTSTYDLTETAGTFTVENLATLATRNAGAAFNVDMDIDDNGGACPTPPAEPADPVIAALDTFVVAADDLTARAMHGRTGVVASAPAATPAATLDNHIKSVVVAKRVGRAGRLPVALPPVLPMQAGESIAIPIGVLPPTTSLTITFDVTINTNISATITQVVNQGEISGSNFATVLTDDPDTPESGDPTITSVPQADLRIEKVDSAELLEPGDAFSYTVSVFNEGPSDALNVVVTDTLPADLNLLGTTGCLNDPNGVPTCDLGTIAAGSGVSYTIDVSSNLGINTTLTNTVVVTSTTHDPITSNNVATETTTIAPVPEVTLGLGGSPFSENGGTAVITATLSNTYPLDVLVEFDFSGTADVITDYVRSAISITVPVGEISGTLTLTGVDDDIYEGDETVIADVITVTNGIEAMGTQSVTAIIEEDDPLPMVLLNTAGSPFDEAGGTAVISATLSNASIDPITITLSFSGTATLGADYVVSDTQIVIPALGTSGFITVTGQDDLIAEGDETVVVEVDTVENGQEVGDQLQTLIITDDDIPGVSVAPTSVSVAEGGATATYTVRLQTAPVQPVTITLNTGAQIDPFGPLVFAADVTATDPQTVTVTATDDAIAEGDHSATITHAAASSDPIYNSIVISDVLVAITDNDVLYSFSAGAPTVDEGDVGVTAIGFTINRTGDLSSTSSVDFDLTLSTAISGTDFTFTGVAGTGVTVSGGPTTRTITFDPGATTAVISFGVLGDFVDESNESVTVRLTNPQTSGSGTADVAPSTRSTTIIDDDERGLDVVGPDPDLTVSESGITDTYTLALTSQPTDTVDIAIMPDNAEVELNGAGFGNPITVTFTITNWNVPQTITVAAEDDIDPEGPHETILAHTGSGGDYDGLVGPDVTVNIVDNDVPGVTVQPTDLSVSEAGTTAVFTITLDSQPTAAVTITLSTGDPGECTVAPPSVSLDAANHETGVPVTVTGVDDAVDDGDQLCTVITGDVTSPDPNYDAFTGADVADVDVVVVDDDGAPSINFDAATYTVDESIGNLFITVTLSSESAFNVSVDYAMNDGTAVSPDDYTSESGTLAFAPSQTEATLIVAINNDTQFEADETFDIVLSNPVSGTLGMLSEATVTITDNDVPPAISIADASASETDATTTMTFTVSLAEAAGLPVTVDYSTADGTALAGTHYAAASGTLTIPAGETSGTIGVTIFGDEVENPDRTFFVSLSNPVNAVFGENQATGTILDDDAQRAYLPVIFTAVPTTVTTAPDLVIESLTVTSSDIQVVVRNDGTAASINDFWVDAYIDPEEPPTAVNQIVGNISEFGAVWGVTDTTLVPGARLTLTLGSPFYTPTLSNMPAPIPATALVYAQVDSAHTGTTFGNVLELHEVRGEPYNNVAGPVSVTADAALADPLLLPPADEDANRAPLPRRP